MFSFYFIHYPSILKLLLNLIVKSSNCGLNRQLQIVFQPEKCVITTLYTLLAQAMCFVNFFGYIC